MTLRFIDAQLFQQLAWALRDHAIIVSGHYKQRKTQRGPTEEEAAAGAPRWIDETNEEKLADAIGTLTSRCHAIGEIADYIYAMNCEEEASDVGK